ncbi:MAG: Iron-sulfur cluster assembly scaffold protein IscU 2 [Methanonatronarchaeales archaeon]|nr:Iron-sulfur cluster assembly scaffold protein IscU 2 [Methanonatronarchaeales archaeon]
MRPTTYSEKVKEHFTNPRNSGEMENPDAVGEVGNPACGDVMHIFLKVEDDRVEDISWTTMGCAAAIATSSMISELARGEELEEAWKITKRDVSESLEGLPPIKQHCSNLAADGLHEAIKNYLIGEGRWENQFDVNPMEVAEPAEVEHFVEAGITEDAAERLRDEGFLSRPNVLYASPDYLAEKGGIDEEQAREVRRYFEEDYGAEHENGHGH